MERNKSNPELISIIVIAYNEEKRILKCLESILSQKTCKEFEVIIIDDGSLDNTVKVIKDKYNDEKKIKVVELIENQGRGAARAKGVSTAKGSLIGFVDADIVLQSNWLEVLSHEIIGKSAVSGVAVPDGDCAVVWRICQPTARIKAGSEEITGNNVLFDGEVLRSNPFSEKNKLGEDFRLASSLRKKGHKLATINTLSVEHNEAKTYRKAIKWLYESGIDATRLLIEYRRPRLPDLAATAWLTSLLLLSLFIIYEKVSVHIGLLTQTILTILISGAHCYSRFNPRIKTLNWIKAFAANIPLMTAYLLGRLTGVIVIIYERYVKKDNS
jgi:glycosyltransferase involved in cell wall biosynthesis